MKLLVACEYSGTVRDAFTARGYDATSCDILPSDTPGKHYQGDVFDILDDGWDMMIAHPPCTYLSSAGNRHYHKPERVVARYEALSFVLDLYNCDIPMIAIENPVGFLNTAWRKPDQIIEPYYFGERTKKRTCLWLKELPPLWCTGITEKPKPIRTDYRGHNVYATEAVTCNRRHNRSLFFKGIAAAMADQWGGFLKV